MDTSVEETVATDSLGRRIGPRRQQHMIEEKQRIVKETYTRGASVAEVARRYEFNANQVFAWRRLYWQGLLKENSEGPIPSMLPVKVSTPTVLQSETAADRVEPKSRPTSLESAIEIDLPNGYGVRVRGRVDAKMLSQVIDVLVRR